VIDEIVTIRSALSFTGRYGTWILPIGFVVGLLSPALTELARPLAEPLVLLLFAISIYRVDPAEIRARLRGLGYIALGIFWVLLAVPSLVYGAGRLADLPDDLLVVAVAWSACPPLAMVPGLALLLGLDAAAALLIMVGATMVFPVTFSVVLAILGGGGFGDGSALAVAGRLMAMVLGCSIVGQGARWLVGAERARETAPAVDGLLVILLSLFAVTIMGGLHRSLETDAARIPLFLATAFCASAFLQVITAAAFWRLPRTFSGAAALASGNRNFALLLPIMSAETANDMWLYLGVVQFPIYLLPMISRPFYRLYRAGGGTGEAKERDKNPQTSKMPGDEG
jgi:predicted permease